MLRALLAWIVCVLVHFALYPKEVRDTVLTQQGDKIILSYNVSTDGDRVSVNIPNTPRIIPSERLRKECKGDLSRLKTVVFDQVGNTGNVKWEGLTPSAFMVPSGMSYDKSDDGFYIFGESNPITFMARGGTRKEIKFPLYIALYEKKQTYRIVSGGSRPLSVAVGNDTQATGRSEASAGYKVERIAVSSTEELEADNRDVVKALSSIRMAERLLETENELPFSQTLVMEIQNLQSLKDRLKDNDVVEKINSLFLEINLKEKELKSQERQSSLSTQAQQQALEAQQKQEEEERKKAAEEQARIQEEQQRQQTLWMIIGGIVLALLAFIGNAVFKHFRDLKNQENILKMQESFAREAKNEAGRRSREIARNQARQMENKGKNALRGAVKNQSKPQKKSNIKSI